MKTINNIKIKANAALVLAGILYFLITVGIYGFAPILYQDFSLIFDQNIFLVICAILAIVGIMLSKYSLNKQQLAWARLISKTFFIIGIVLLAYWLFICYMAFFVCQPAYNCQ